MLIRVLSFEGCPNCEATRSLVQETVREMHLEADVESIRVRDDGEAQRYGFLGSPTVQVDGRDIEVSRRTDTVSFACRVYKGPHGITGVPPKSLLVDALEEARRIT